MNAQPTHGTRDWKRLHEDGQAYIDMLWTLNTRRRRIPQDLENYADTVRTQMTDLLAEDEFTEETKNKAAWKTERIIFSTIDDPDRTFELTISLWEDEYDKPHMDVEFSIHLNQSQDRGRERSGRSEDNVRKPLDGPFFHGKVQDAERVVDYLFDVRQEATEIAETTLLSQREAEVHLLTDTYDERGAWETICNLMDITKSNLTTYQDRLDTKIEDAEQQREEAERTLDILKDQSDGTAQ